MLGLDIGYTFMSKPTDNLFNRIQAAKKRLGGQALDENFRRAAKNLPRVDVLPQQGANVYDILRRDTLVLTKDAVEALEARLK